MDKKEIEKKYIGKSKSERLSRERRKDKEGKSIEGRTNIDMEGLKYK